uniref:Uncharacterized protein n=1 Tax=Plectus sambesii TaxID=2011161 RepID=A0A914UT64_9BILA
MARTKRLLRHVYVLSALTSFWAAFLVFQTTVWTSWIRYSTYRHSDIAVFAMSAGLFILTLKLALLAHCVRCRVGLTLSQTTLRWAPVYALLVAVSSSVLVAGGHFFALASYRFYVDLDSGAIPVNKRCNESLYNGDLSKNDIFLRPSGWSFHFACTALWDAHIVGGVFWLVALCATVILQYEFRLHGNRTLGFLEENAGRAPAG